MAIAPSASAQVPPTGARREHVARGVVTTHPVVIARAEGSRVWDLDGREYLDFAGGIGAMNVGHSHPDVIAAAAAQLQRLTHAAFQVAEYEPYLQVCARLNALVPCPRPTKSILLTTGVEAVENAIKMARAYTGRAAIVSFQGAFHGRTLLGLSLTASNSGYRQNFGPFASEVYHSPYPYEYRGWTTERALDALDELFATRVAADRVAAVLIEPQLGEGGFDVRGLGAMLALELVEDREGRTPATPLAQRAIEYSRNRGLLLLTCGAHRNIIRCLPPLTVTIDEIRNALGSLQSALLDARSPS